MNNAESRGTLWVVPMIAVLLIGPAVGPSARADDVPCTWADTPIMVDGKTTDWANLSGRLLTDQQAALAVCNDGEYLYCTFRTTDLRWIGTIKMAGLTLYLDRKGGKSKDLYVRYADGPSREQMRAARGDDDNQMGMRRPGGGRRGEGPRGGAERAATLHMYIKDRIVEKEIPPDGSQGPAAAFDTCQGFYTYEFRIPLAEGETLYYGLGAKPGDKIGIGCIWGDMSEFKKDRPGGDFGSIGIPGGPGRPGGDMGDGPPKSRGGFDRADMPSKQEVWIATTLAVAPAATVMEE